MAFFVGQKVVCINDDPNFMPGGNGMMCGLTAGNVYTVRRIGIDPRWLSPSLWLAEIHRGNRPNGLGECGYNQRRFRPVVEKKTDISIFTAMLTPKKVTEPV